MTNEMQHLLDLSVGIALDGQFALNELVGDQDWTCDIGKGVLRFGNRHRFLIQILGTESAVSDSWLWAWGNKDSGLNTEFLKDAQKLRLIGKKEEVDELTEPSFSLAECDGHAVAAVAVHRCNGNAYYRMPQENGAVFVVIHDAKFPEPNDVALHIVNLFPQAISNYPAKDHLAAFQNYVGYHNFKTQVAGRKLVARRENTPELVADFDSKRRLKKLSLG